MKNILFYVWNKKGSEMVEATISLPIVILTVLLLLRLFIFYIEILTCGINNHDKALQEWDKYGGNTLKIYEVNDNITMIKGGLLQFDLNKRLNIKAYFFNEDNLVRSREILKNKE